MRDFWNCIDETGKFIGETGKKVIDRAEKVIDKTEKVVGEKAKEVVKAVEDESVLIGQIRAAIAAGGINIAMYIIGDPKVKGDREFKYQADGWAGNHGAFGLAAGKVKKDYAMVLSAEPGKLVTDLLAAIKKELGTDETIPIANVALFAHGPSATTMRIDSRGPGGGEGDVDADSKVVENFAAAVKPSLTAGAKIHLFACDTAMDLDPHKARDDPKRKDDFAEKLQQKTGAEVWGHEDPRHVTGNPELVEVTDTNHDGNAERYQLRDVLARKFLVYVDATLTEPQMGYLEKKLKISAWINDCMQFKGAGFKQTDEYQVFIEDISSMGFDELFDLLIADSPPDAATFRKLFPEHDQIDQMVHGAVAIHAQFHAEMEKKKKAIADAKTKPDFPFVAPKHQMAAVE
jgi:hypothetical protein